MKKILISLISACLVFGIILTCACHGNNTSDKKLTYGKKYYSASSIGESASDSYYYVFDKNGTGTYSNCYTSYDEIKTGYVIEFNYTVMDDTVICTFNSEVASYNDIHCDSYWYMALKFSEDFLIRQGQYGESVYFCENYLKTVPNFGK